MEQIENYYRARVPAIQLVTSEELRVIEGLMELALRMSESNPVPIYIWSVNSGVSSIRIEGKKLRKTAVDASLTAPEAIIPWIQAREGDGIFVVCDFHPYIADDTGSPGIRRQVREMVQVIRNTTKLCIFLQPRRNLPADLQNDVVVWEMPLPNASRLNARIAGFVKFTNSKTASNLTLTDDTRDGIVEAGLGLTREQFDAALSMALVQTGSLDNRAIPFVIAKKREIVAQLGGLEFFEPSTNMSSVGGLGVFKKWAQKRRRAFGQDGRNFGLPMPKGVLLLGVSGTGKSLACKSLASEWNMPLLRLDMGAMFGSLVGESEENIRNAIRLAEAMSPCILWVDEIEKGIGGGDRDGGTSERVVATLLNWMNERKSPVFIMATANDVRRILSSMPELLRKGRFDEIFFIDLPNKVEREEIIRIHLVAKGRNPNDFDIARIAAESKGYSGAELEAAIVDALFAAFDEESQQVTTDHIIHAIAGMKPLSITAAETVDNLRAWAQQNAVIASDRSTTVQHPPESPTLGAGVADVAAQIVSEGWEHEFSVIGSGGPGDEN